MLECVDYPFCEHVFVPGAPYSREHLLGIIDRAIAEGDPEFALRTARNVDPPIELDRALRLTIALALRPHPQFEAAARRFVSRFADGAEGVTLRNVAQVADALATLSIVSNAGETDKREAERGHAPPCRTARTAAGYVERLTPSETQPDGQAQRSDG